MLADVNFFSSQFTGLGVKMYIMIEYVFFPIPDGISSEWQLMIMCELMAFHLPDVSEDPEAVPEHRHTHQTLATAATARRMVVSEAG